MYVSKLLKCPRITTVTTYILHKKLSKAMPEEAQYVFRRSQNDNSDDRDGMCCIRLLQTRAAVTWEARSPMVDSRVQHTASVDNEAECRQCHVPEQTG